MAEKEQAAAAPTIANLTIPQIAALWDLRWQGRYFIDGKTAIRALARKGLVRTTDVGLTVITADGRRACEEMTKAKGIAAA